MCESFIPPMPTCKIAFVSSWRPWCGLTCSGGPGRLLFGRLPEGSAGLCVGRAPPLRPGQATPYLGPDGKDWPDNHLRFAALSWVGGQIALDGVDDWHPEIVHVHDWQAGLTPAYLRFSERTPAAHGNDYP